MQPHLEKFILIFQYFASSAIKKILKLSARIHADFSKALDAIRFILVTGHLAYSV